MPQATFHAATWFALAFAVATAARASPDDLGEGLRLFGDMEYEAAMPMFARAKADESLTKEQRASAALHLAIVQLSFGDEESARRNAREAVGLHREVALPVGASPAVTRLLEDARAALPEAPPAATTVSMRHDPPAAGRRALQADVDPRHVELIEQIVVHYRTTPGAAYQRLEASAGQPPGRYDAVVPGEPGAIEYYFEASDPGGRVVASAGSAALPFVVPGPPPPPKEPAIYETWWFWTGIGVLVAGGVTAGVVAGTSGGAAGGGGCGAPTGFGCLEITSK